MLFPQELELRGDRRGKRLVHVQCDAGEDTLCLARRGALVTSADLSDQAIRVARELSDAARWLWPPGAARVPSMHGVAARKA